MNILRCSKLAFVLLAILLPVPFRAQALPRSRRVSTNQHRRAPTALQIVERFIQAVGGRKAWLRIKSQYGAGTIEVLNTNSRGTFQIYAKPPNLVLLVMRLAQGEFRTGFDGQKSWSQKPPNRAQYDPPERQAESKRDADFYKYLHFKEHFPNAKVIGIEDVEGSKAYVVEATGAGDTLPERLYFDLHTGLLVLRDTSRGDGQGEKKPDLLYYQDYRLVDEVKVAFQLRIVQGDVTIITRQTEAKNNITIDDAIFALPIDARIGRLTIDHTAPRSAHDRK